MLYIEEDTISYADTSFLSTYFKQFDYIDVVEVINFTSCKPSTLINIPLVKDLYFSLNVFKGCNYYFQYHCCID